MDCAGARPPLDLRVQLRTADLFGPTREEGATATDLHPGHERTQVPTARKTGLPLHACERAADVRRRRPGQSSLGVTASAGGLCVCVGRVAVCVCWEGDSVCVCWEGDI